MNVKDRLSAFIRYKGLTIRDFEKSCGLSNGYVNSIRQGIGSAKLQDILSVYPEINRDWLVYGDGNMLSTSDNIGNTRTHVHNIASDLDAACTGSVTGGSTPGGDVSSESSSLESTAETNDMQDVSMVRLIPISVQGGPLNDFDSQVRPHDCELMISPIKGVDFAIQVSGDSMAPEYPEGSRLFVKRIKDGTFIEWGRVFVLNTCNGTVLKVLVPSDKENCVRCISLNPDPRYAPFDVNMGDIRGIYRVLLCMSMK